MRSRRGLPGSGLHGVDRALHCPLVHENVLFGPRLAVLIHHLETRHVPAERARTIATLLVAIDLRRWVSDRNRLMIGFRGGVWQILEALGVPRRVLQDASAETVDSVAYRTRPRRPGVWNLGTDMVVANQPRSTLVVHSHQDQEGNVDA